jgi:Asp-tRNA(Asn)/Glu-tRNA(Gln) amidotransferase A subunit family amidase
VPGPIARTAADCATLWQVMAALSVRPIAPRVPAVIGVVRQLPATFAAASVQAGFARALDRLRALGAAIEEVDVPGADRATLVGALGAAHELAQSRYAARALSPAGRLTVALGRAVAPEAARLAKARAAITDALARAFERAPVLAMPTSAIPAPALTRTLAGGAQDGVLLRALGAYTPLANVTGAAAISVPCGADDRGRSLSIMFVAPAGEEDALLALAHALEAA